MTEIFVPLLYCLAGFCAFAVIQHALIAAHEAWDRAHLMFAVLAFSMLLFVVADAAGYRSVDALAFVELRRWQVTFAMMLFCALHWFVAFYSGFRPRAVLLLMTLFFASGVILNLALPYGLGLAEVPTLKYLKLPWGEQILDMRSYKRNTWNSAYWLGIFLSFIYLAFACAHLYRAARRRAVILGLALCAFLACLIVNLLIVVRIIEFVGIAEFAFVGLVGVMSYELHARRREEKHRTTAILDHIPAAVYVKNLTGQYLLSNNENDRILEAGDNSPLGKTDYDFFSPVQADEFRAADNVTFEKRVPNESEFSIERRGERRIYNILRFPLLDSGGIPYAVTGIATDVTEFRLAQTESEALRNKVIREDRLARIGVLVSSLTHELAQPLTAALANAQAGERLLAHEPPDIAELKEVLHDIVRDEKRAAGLISSLRSMVRKKETPRENVDLGECIANTISLLQSELRMRSVEIDFSTPDRHIVLANRSQIQQVIINLIMNAAQAMNETSETDRKISIALATEESRCRVAVTDNGAGIPSDDLDKVFENFYTTSTDGLGMGLAICRSIVTSHGGTIWAEGSDTPGAKILFTIPI